jgi:hypothetical protein
MAISMAQRQHLCKKNMVWQNTIYSITNQDFNLKILRDMNCSMAHIFVTAKFFWEMSPYGCNFQFLKKS